MRSITRHSRHSTVPVLALSAALLAGCGGDGDDGDVALTSPSPEVEVTVSPFPVITVSPSPTSSPTTTSSPTATASPTGGLGVQWARCTSTRAELRVAYPADWTARDYPDGGCAYFDPEPFQVERGTEAPSVAVRLDVENVAYDRVREGYLRGDVISQDETGVAGYEGIRIEDRDTEGPLAPKGQRLTYLADLGTEKTLILTTNETDAEDFERAKQILDEMAQRLQRTS